MSWVKQDLFKKMIFLLLILSSAMCWAQALGLHDSQGRVIHPAQYQNKWVILNYWAEWCDSCIVEIPELNNFHRNTKSKNIVIYGINYDQLTQRSLNMAILKTGIRFPVLTDDPSLVWQIDDVYALPTTFIINPQGKVVKKLIGPNTEQELLRYIENNVAANLSTKAQRFG